MILHKKITIFFYVLLFKITRTLKSEALQGLITSTKKNNAGLLDVWFEGPLLQMFKEARLAASFVFRTSWKNAATNGASCNCRCLFLLLLWRRKASHLKIISSWPCALLLICIDGHAAGNTLRALAGTTPTSTFAPHIPHLLLLSTTPVLVLPCNITTQ